MLEGILLYFLSHLDAIPACTPSHQAAAFSASKLNDEGQMCVHQGLGMPKAGQKG